jgi:predicted PurR-regulated permease PerM
MGLFFRSHVLLVLVLLLTGEHLFGIWGLLLAVPIGHYAVEYGLLGRKASFQ